MRLDQLFCSSLVQLFCLQLYSYLRHFCRKVSHDISNYFPLSHFFSCGVILLLSTVMFTKLLMFAVPCSGYAAQLLDYLWQLSICSRISRFMACIYSISDLYISKISSILLMVFTFAAHTHSKVEVQKSLPYSYLRTYNPINFTSFQMCLKYFLCH